MRLKSFYGSTMTEAMGLVREALGDDAIIVATRNDERGGVRVTAAVEEKRPPPKRQPPTAYADYDEGDTDSIEIISNTLVQHHVPAALAEKLLATATQYASEDPLLAFGAAIDTHILYAPFEEGAQERPLVMIGPPGAGKTLCTAKLATKTAINQQKAALISTDTERAGGMAQLDAFARILNTDLLEIEDPHTLQDAIAMQPKGTATYVDTAGCNPFNVNEKQALAAILSRISVEPCLVLPADMDADIALDMAKEFAALGAKRIIATRLDMTRKMGGLLKVSYESGLPLCAYSQTSKVTEALLPLNPVSLARLFLPYDQQTLRKPMSGVA